MYKFRSFKLINTAMNKNLRKPLKITEMVFIGAISTRSFVLFSLKDMFIYERGRKREEKEH